MIATSRWARCSACSESRRVPVKRQMTMIEARPSITESRPKPSSATELARIAAVIAIAPSRGHVGEAEPGQRLGAADQAVALGQLELALMPRGARAARRRQAARATAVLIAPPRRVRGARRAAGGRRRSARRRRSCARGASWRGRPLRSVRRWWPTRFSARAGDPRQVADAQLLAVAQRERDQKPRRVGERLRTSAPPLPRASRSQALCGSPRHAAGPDTADRSDRRPQAQTNGRCAEAWASGSANVRVMAP